MNFKGERFHIPLDDDEDDYDEQERQFLNKSAPQPPTILENGMVKDVLERPATLAAPPLAPSLRISSTNGFPIHKKRAVVSRFKQARSADAAPEQTNDVCSVPTSRSFPEATVDDMSDKDREKRQIDKENQERLAQMSDDQIERERKELMEGLSPSLIERLLRRANINTDTGPDDFPQTSTTTTREGRQEPPKSTKRVAFEETPTQVVDNNGVETADRQPVPVPVPVPELLGKSESIPPIPSIHFPHPPQAPGLDPSSSTFHTELHEKYFPSLPSDPDKLAWMADPSETETQSPYSPSQESIPSAALRFSFRGTLIPPRTARSIPVTAGLHHHGEAPESAGYTIPELAHLARSSFPTQRCISFQTLGRLMYRLGRGDFGLEESTMAQGLWKCIKEGRVLQTLQEEVDRVGGHMSAKAYATEALWLWQKGGGQRWKAS